MKTRNRWWNCRFGCRGADVEEEEEEEEEEEGEVEE